MGVYTCVCLCVEGRKVLFYKRKKFQISHFLLPSTTKDLKKCYSDMKTSFKKSKTPKKPSKSREKELPQTSSPSWVEVLTDVLLGYLSQPSQLWRSVVVGVFRRIVSHVTSAVVQLITEVSLVVLFFLCFLSLSLCLSLSLSE